MALKPLLFVGCGGSGGVTLMYLMDALRTELSRMLEQQRATVDLGTRGIPDAWQFVHVDVPEQPDGARKYRPPTVRDQGGRYVGIAARGLTYGQVADSVWGAAGSRRPDLMAGWMRKPGPNDPDLAFGAGQERAVGRAATLRDLQRLGDQLKAATGRMTASLGQLSELAGVLGSTTGNKPVVFIVSSMSGGSGASMVLDVAQLLARSDPALALTASMFLYTSEVFESLEPGSRMGVEANGLAALGELIATSLGANRAEGQLFEALGVGGEDVSRPFRRVFPIGSRHGQNQAVFGDGSMETIYRAVGRALAALMIAPGALDDFIDYDVTNQRAPKTEMKWLGEGAPSEEIVQWGTFGYARLSLGRDRYGEYVAQRFARLGVDRLVMGHMRGETDSGEVQLRRVAEDAHARLLRKLSLPGPTEGADVSKFLGRGDVQEARRSLRSEARAMLDQELLSDQNLGMPLPAERFLALLRQLIGQRNPAVKSGATRIGYAHTYSWHRQFVTSLLTELEDVVARDGLSAARQVVVALKDDADRWVTQLRQESRALGAAGGLELPAEEAQSLQGGAVMAPDHPARTSVLTGLVERSVRAAAQAAAAYMADALADFGGGFADPLATALQRAQSDLTTERERPAGEFMRSELRTNVYAEWPAGDRRVPPRFAGSHNEVLVLDVAEFAPQFDAHLAAVARTGGETAADAGTIDRVLRQILSDRWADHRELSMTPESSVLLLVSPWVPPQLTADPHDPAQVHSRSAARFTLAFSPTEVLGRARAWVTRDKGEYREYLKLDLSGYVSGTGLQDQERVHRRNRLAAKFAETLQQALPLVQVSANAVRVLHPQATPVEQFKFSAVPFESDEATATALLDVLRARSAPEHTVKRFEDSVKDGGASFIDVFSSYPPLSPLAFPSLLKPLNDAWRRSVASRHTDFFWTNRRARVLPGCLPMSVPERRATIAGYVIGKITGRLRGSYAHKPNAAVRPLEVYDEERVKWLAFPAPLLTPFLSGFANDEFAAILESQLLAMAACGHDSSLAPLLPYIALRRLFGEVIQAPQVESMVDDESRGFAAALGRQCLGQWVFEGLRLPGGGPIGPERVAGVTYETVEERRKGTLEYLSTVIDNRRATFQTDDPLRNPYLRQYDRRPLAASLATDFVWALEEVHAMVAALDEWSFNSDTDATLGPGGGDGMDM